MSLTYDQISAITEKKFVKRMVDNIFDSGPILKELKDKSYTSVDGGTSIIQPLNYAQVSAGGTFAGADTLDTTDNNVFSGAEYSWKQYYVNVTVTRRDELINSGAPAQLNFVKEKIKVAEKTLKDLMSTGIHSTGSDAKGFNGLRSIVGTANTVGGISQTSFTWWAGAVDSSTTTLTLSALQTGWNSIAIDSDKPNIGITTRTLFNSLWSLLQPQQRFQDSKKADAGFQNLLFNGTPVMADNKCPASHFYFLNTDYLYLYYHPEENFRFDPFIKRDNQQVRTAKVFFMGALGSSNNRMHWKASALTS